VFTGPLHSNGRPILARVSLRGNVFTESLPSNGYALHSIVCRGALPTYALLFEIMCISWVVFCSHVHWWLVCVCVCVCVWTTREHVTKIPPMKHASLRKTKHKQKKNTMANSTTFSVLALFWKKIRKIV
jgi:hypothetical protein